MSSFNGLPKGGCWTLTVSDNAAADTGSISRWQVSVLNSPTAAVPSTWGSVKTLYR
jgi:subtilisin-like proprotein convertase family protein